jgi:hypothetical protein
MRLTWKQYAEIGGDVLAIIVASYFGKWPGFAFAVVVIFLVYSYKALMILQTTRDVLLSRLPDRCAMCHREILDDPGVLDRDFDDELKTYHEACSERLDAMKQRDKALRQAEES